MLTKDQVLEMIDKALFIYVGVRTSGDTCYFRVSHEVARRNADEIAGFGLSAEFGNHACLTDCLYIEGGH